MRNKIVAAVVMLLAAAGRAGAAEFFVSPTGDDAGPGTKDRPLKTFAAAQKAVRASPARGVEPVTVWFGSGAYSLPETVVFTAADSGTPAAPVVYAASSGGAAGGDEIAVLSGGVRVEGLRWEPDRGGVFKAAVPPGLTTDQLFVNGTRQILARYPNFDPGQPIFNGFAADAFGPDRAKNWADPRGAFIHAMHRNQWGDYSYLITGKDDRGNVTYTGGWQNNRQMGMHARYRMVEGVREELDAPGEWFLDAAAGTLYFYPPAGMTAADLGRAAVEFVRLRGLVEFRGTPAAPVRGVTLRGFSLRHAARTFMDNKEPLLRSDWTIYRGGAVVFDGAEDCGLADCFIDQVGGNAVFVNNYNRRVRVAGCRIAGAGANGVAFVGDPGAVRDPLFEYNGRTDYAKLDRTPGPKTDNYPADCAVEDCLIYQSGRVEKQTAPVQIAMSRRIAVRHCSIYDVPRAGINIGDGCWGGHVVEFCDVFDTVQETGDHGSFNSWGRDRFWDRDTKVINAEVAKDPALPLLDVVEPITLRNNRWRCDHGWDIDLDDGSSNYEIYNNLCLNGGIKFREGYRRRGENNVLVGNSFHPHVWLADSGDVFRRNIVSTPYRPIGMPAVWGAEVDSNFLNDPTKQLTRDKHSAAGDAQFVDPARGDFRVKDGSPALGVGFRNFPMDGFGVTSPALKALARVPRFGPAAGGPAPAAEAKAVDWLGAKAKDVTTAGEQSAAGLPTIAGVLLHEVPAGTRAATAGLHPMDVIVECGGKPVNTVADLRRALGTPKAGDAVKLGVVRTQHVQAVEFVWDRE